MAKREYTGQPIDLTDLPGEQHISERTNGETVAGTSKDDMGDETTIFLPEDVSKDEISDKQWNAITAFQVEGDKEDPSFYSLAKDRDFSPDTAKRAVHRVFRGTRDIEDISPSHRLAVLILGYEGLDASPAELEDKYPLSRRALQEAERVYPDLVDQYSDVEESELKKAVKTYSENKHDGIRGNGTDDSSASNETQSAENSNSDISQIPKEEKNYPEDFTETYQWFIETVSDHPSKSKQEIESLIPEEKDFSGQNYYNAVRSYPDIVKQRIVEKGTATSQNDLCSYLQKHIELPSTDENDTDESEQSDTDDGNKPDYDSLDSRLRSVESKIESLRLSVEGSRDVEPENDETTQLANLIVDSVPDDELGRLIKDSFNQSLGGDDE